MRTGTLIALLTLASLVVPAHSDPPNRSPSAASESNEANWANWDAQARIADGDYEGAVQAEQLAQAARKQAEELCARATKARPSVTAHPTAPDPGDGGHQTRGAVTR
jgi:hypothetical protein